MMRCAYGLALGLGIAVAGAGDAVAEALRVEIAYDEPVLDEPVLKSTNSLCRLRGHRSRLRNAVRLPTYYYEVPFRAEGAELIVRDAAGTVLHTARIEAFRGYGRYGYDNCRYWMASSLPGDFERQRDAVRVKIRDIVRSHYERRAGELATRLRAEVETTRFALIRRR